LRAFAPIAVAFTALVLQSNPALGLAQAGGDDLPTVAVLDFTGLMMGQAGNSAPLGKAVSSMLTTELMGRSGLRVIERHQLQDLLTEQKLALSGRVDESTAVEIGKLLGAQYMIYGQVTSIATQLRMDMRAVDVETSEILEAQKMNASTDELLDVVVEMADAFGSQLDLTPPSGRPAMEAIPVRATIEFSRAVDFEDKGDIEKALEHYRVALEIFPAHPAAQAAVDRLGAEGEGDR
jgi:TolB-like protein